MIDFGKVATNALSMLVGAVFVGAAAIVWNAATTVDDRIEKASANLEATQETLVSEVAAIKGSLEAIESTVAGLERLMRAQHGDETVSRATPSPTDKESVQRDTLHKLQEEIQRKSLEIYQQR